MISEKNNDNLMLSKFKSLISESKYNNFFYDLLFKDKITKTIFIDGNNMQIIVIDSIIVRNVYNNIIENKIRIDILGKIFYYSKLEFLKIDYENFINLFSNFYKDYYLSQKLKIIYLQEKFI